MRAFFVFDVESVGLHGEAFAVAGGVYLENGAAQWEFSYACPIDECCGVDSDREWVKQNVPLLQQTHNHPKPMRNAFWSKWLSAKARYPNITMAAECGWPVEARFLAQCVDDDVEMRRWQGPYPLHDVASFMAAAGMDPMATYERTASEMPVHDPLADARLSARLLAEAIKRTALEEVQP